MSEHFLQLQIGALNILEKPKYMFLEIAFDETETPMRMDLNGEAVRRPAGVRADKGHCPIPTFWLYCTF